LKIDLKTLVFVLGCMGLSVGGAVLCALLRGGWVSATVLNVVMVAVMLGWTVHQRHRLLARLLTLSLVAGIVEVAVADPPFIHTGMLRYLGNGPTFFESPAYMPLGWVYVVGQLGALALWLDERLGVRVSCGATMVLGALLIPVYETLANFAQWWVYRDPHMLFGTTPWCVIAAEGLIGLGIAVLVRPMDGRSFWWSGGLGAILGLWMWVAGTICHRLIG
jgi:hypothetical protein